MGDTIHKTVQKHRTQNRKQYVQNKKTNIERIIKKLITSNWNITSGKRHKANSNEAMRQP